MRKRIYEQDLEDIVSNDIQNQIKIILDIEKYLNMLREKQAINIRKLKNEHSNIKSKIEKLSFGKVELYEKYLDKEITKENYIKTKNTLTSTIDNLKECAEQLLEQINNISNDFELDKESEKIKQYLDFDKLTYEIVYSLISKIIVYTETNVEIVWNFKDYNLERFNLPIE